MKTQIGISFGDNDFTQLFKAFFDNVILKLDFEPTKEQVVELFNSSAFGLYLAFQNRFEYGDRDHNLYLKNSYLQISVDDVYFDQEITDYMNNHFSNAEFFWTDGRTFMTF